MAESCQPRDSDEPDWSIAQMTFSDWSNDLGWFLRSNTRMVSTQSLDDCAGGDVVVITRVITTLLQGTGEPYPCLFTFIYYVVNPTLTILQDDLKN